MLQNHPASFHPSPARLGLANPNSPSIPSPHPNISSTKSSTSSAPFPSLASRGVLLPLLPPLPRAQCTLSQMASLATKLFEISPYRPQWLASFRGSFPTFISPSTTTALDPSPSTPKEILSLSSSLQAQLFDSVSELQEIIDLQNTHQKISHEIRSKDASLRAFAKKLHEAQNHLQLLVDDYADYIRPTKRQKGSDSTSNSDSSFWFPKLDLSDILSYAHRLSYTTFAPPEFGSGQAPLRGALPPAPQEEQMRASQLYNFANLDVGLPKEPEQPDKKVETLIEAPHLPEAPRASFEDVPGMLIPPIPAGWQPGMPVELPTDIPIIPPGWKPGDPVPLPPLDGLLGPVSKISEEQRPIVHPPLPKAPEPIQVRYVKLDIDSDHDDYSSDYATSGSSEEENED